jgi:phosphohistidine phosphatase
MLRLTLVRHAKTEPAHPGQEDWDRMLEARGQRDAPEMGRRLKGRGRKPDAVLTSPAVRALATTSIMTRELGVAASKVTQDERLYLASPKELLRVVKELGGKAKHLMVVGHNPGLTEFADALASDRSLDNLPTCGVFTLEFDIEDWADLELGTGANAEFDYPRST